MAHGSQSPSHSYALTTFGTLTLSSEATSSLAQQRRRLALLALLAASGERGLTRDQILTYLWPEADAGSARHSLEQLVHATRRALGDTVFSGVNPLALNTELVTSDVVEFDRALLRGDVAQAVALYHGPFLHGFYLDDAPGFERWTETERARLAHQYANALRQLAAAAEGARDYTTAIAWWRRLVEAEPLSSRSALGLMRALVASGDQAAALQHGRIHEALVRQELDTAPDPSIVSYLTDVRAGRIESAPASVAATLPPSRLDSAPSAATVTPTVDAATPDRSAAIRSALFPARRWAVAVVAVIAILLVAWYGWHRSDGPVLDPNRIVILPFAVTGGDSSVKDLGEVIVDLLSPMLDGEGGLSAVYSRTAVAAWNRVSKGREATIDLARSAGREVGAGRALVGTVVLASGRLTLTASLVDVTRGEAQPLQSVTGHPDSLRALLDPLLSQLLLRSADVLPRTLATLMSQSTPALRAYADGYRAYRRSQVGMAIRAFDRALDLDSTFALAALQLATATTKMFRQRGVCANYKCRWRAIILGMDDARDPGDDERYERAVRLAWEYRHKLPSRDLPLLEALRRNSNRATRASDLNAALERAAAAAPDRADIQYLRGLVMLFQGSAMGYTDALARAEGLFASAQLLDSAFLPPLARLVDVAAYQADVAKLRRYGAAYLARDQSSSTAEFVRWRLAVGVGDSASARDVRSRFSTMDPATLRQIVRASVVSGVALGDAERAVAAIVDRESDRLERGSALFTASSLALNRGRPQMANSILLRRQELDSARAGFWQSTTLAALFGDGELSTAEASVREREQWIARDTTRWTATNVDTVPPDVATQLWQQGMWDWFHGDLRKARQLGDWVRRHQWPEPADVIDMLVATSERRSDAPTLRARVDSMTRRGCCRPPHQMDLMLATAYEMSGEDSAALAVLQRGSEMPEFLATHLLREGRLAQRLGDTALAIHAWEHFLALQSDPEPSLQPRRDSIRLEVDRLQHAPAKPTTGRRASAVLRMRSGARVAAGRRTPSRVWPTSVPSRRSERSAVPRPAFHSSGRPATGERDLSPASGWPRDSGPSGSTAG